MHHDQKNRRRNYFIDKSFQSKFIVKFCLLIIIATLLMSALIYWFNRQTNTVAFENLRVVVKSTADFLLPIILQIVIVVTIVVGMATIAITLFTSHKIAGPLYRLKAETEKIKNKDLSSQVSIRAKDQLQKMASEFNEMRSELKNSVNSIKNNWDSVKKEGLKSESAKQLDSELGKFKTD